MATSWKLDFDGDLRTLRGWGLQGARLLYRNMRPDEFRAKVATPALVGTADPLFTYDVEFSIYRNATRVMVGRVPEPEAYLDARVERQNVQAVGRIHDLDRITFLQERRHFADADGPGIVFDTPALLLFQDINRQQVTLSDQAQLALQQAIDDEGIDIQIGTLDGAFAVPVEEAIDLTVLNVLKRCYRYAPDASAWFDYTTSPPTINIRRRANLAAIEIAVTDLESLSIKPKNDLRIDGVKIFIKRIVTRTSDGSRRIFFDTQVAGVTTGLHRIVATVELDDPRDPLPTSFATNFLSTISTLHWEGEAILKELEPTIAIRPGNVLNLTGGHADWATMNAVVQEVEIDIDTGTTRIVFGPPLFLGMGDYRALLEAAKNKRPPRGDTPDGVLPIVVAGASEPTIECRKRPGTGGGVSASEVLNNGAGVTLSSTATAVYNEADDNWDVSLSATLISSAGGAGGRVKTPTGCGGLGGEFIYLQLADSGSTSGSANHTDLPGAGTVTYQTCVNLDLSGELELCLPANGAWGAWTEVADDDLCIAACSAVLDSTDGCSSYEVEWRINGGGLQPNGHYRVDVTSYRRLIGDSIWTAYATDSFEVQADVTGSLTSASQTTDTQDGYETCVRLDRVIGILSPAPA